MFIYLFYLFFVCVCVCVVGGQPDYSAQWADYYRSMGMHREAEAIEQQAKNMKMGGPAGPNAAPQQVCIHALNQSTGAIGLG